MRKTAWAVLLASTVVAGGARAAAQEIAFTIARIIDPAARSVRAG